MISGPIYNEINNLEIDLCLFIVLPPVIADLRRSVHSFGEEGRQRNDKFVG